MKEGEVRSLIANEIRKADELHEKKHSELGRWSILGGAAFGFAATAVWLTVIALAIGYSSNWPNLVNERLNELEERHYESDERACETHDGTMYYYTIVNATRTLSWRPGRIVDGAYDHEM